MNKIFIENKKRKLESLKKDYPFAKIIDLTSKSAEQEFLVLSPFYPHGNIPIPFSKGLTSCSVEGIWQGLKVFESADVDITRFSNNTMKDLKRSVRKYGKPLGHRKGVNGTELLDYFSARLLIYLPSYKWVLENNELAKKALEKLREFNQSQDLVFLDYNTNEEICDITKPLSHAGLVKLYLNGQYPDANNLQRLKPYTKEEAEKLREALKKEKREYIKKQKLK